MNKELLKEYLSNRYQGWESFLNNIIFPIFGKDDFEDGYEAELLDSQPERRKLATITGIRSIKQVGKIYVGVEPLQIFDVTVSDRVMMERNRVNIQRLIRTVMDQFSCAFMLFHYEDDTRWDWRFTYCRKSAKKEETTDSKRFTFLLGPGQSCRTAADNFIALYEKRESLEIKNIEEAFNVEALSQEFFGKYKAQYEAFVNYMVDPANGMRQDFIDTHFDHSSMTADKIRDREEKPIRDYVKKLLGRIVFLHFLQKKGWLGVPTGKEWGEGDRDFMLKLFENASPEQKENFLDEVLEGLFANGLDTNRSDNGDVYDTGVQGFCNCKIPYLNGGLFERDALDEKTSRFPAKYFESLLTMLSQYNFTIDENDPNDAEVGVDPEMLGRIFENLLEDNKDKGAFYTPKEIVQYMCRESLIAYLQTDQKEDDKKRIRQFVTTHEVESLGELKKEVEQKLIDVKICDPAIGSGAFPMGLLRELFFCRSAIEPNIVEKAADIKRHIIQNNIYGVDIERGAVEIARLRFWLALIVDEKSPEVLPNLDFKIMQGNSLLESYEGIDLSKLATMSDVQIYEPQLNLFGEMEASQPKVIYTQTDKLKEFQANLKRYFEPITHEERTRLRNSIDDYVRHTITYTLEVHKQSEERKKEQICLSTTFTEKQKKAIAEAEANMVHLNEMIENVQNMELINSDFFLWHTWFHDVFSRPSKEGFDIVIGNPPYIDSETMTNIMPELRKQYSQIFTCARGNWDMFVIFVEKGIKLCSFEGIYSFILPNKLIAAKYTSKLREQIVANDIIEIRDYSRLPVFINAAVYPCTIVGRRTLASNDYNSCRFIVMKTVKRIERKNVSLQEIIGSEYWDVFFRSEIEFSIIKRFLASKSIIRDEWNVIGSATVAEAYEIKNVLYDAKESDDSLKVINTGTIDPYKSLWGYKAMQYIKGKYHFPRVSQSDLNNISERRLSQSMSEKLIVAGMSSRIEAVYDVGETLGGKSTTIILGDELRFLLGLLNSKLVSFSINILYNSIKMAGGYLNIGTREIENIPIPQTNEEQRNEISNLVTEILDLTRDNIEKDISSEENKIDRLIYSIYGLSDKEMKYMEGL
ncbi:Eco57I restriction-modification methylase domain-containing protein [Capnocytophaga sputigena]|nr:DNA methyltransferase [Capnocytophaga sputigena]